MNAFVFLHGEFIVQLYWQIPKFELFHFCHPIFIKETNLLIYFKKALKVVHISHIWKVYWIFIFHPILMHLFFYWLWWELPIECGWISYISYGFQDKLNRKGLQVPDAKIWISYFSIQKLNCIFSAKGSSLWGQYTKYTIF